MSFRFLPSHPTPRRFDEHRASREAVDKLVALICAALARRGVPDRDRDDLLQDILVAALEAWPRYDADIATPEKWLNGIILHHIQRWQARCARSPLAKTDEQEPRDQEQNPEDGAMMRELAHQLYQEIPFVYRDAFIAHELEGLSLEEIAVSRGIPVSTAHYYVQEGKRQLDAALARWKAKHRDRGVLLLPLTVKALLDADRTIPSPPDAVMAFAWRLVQRKLGRTARLTRARATTGTDPATPMATAPPPSIRARVVKRAPTLSRRSTLLSLRCTYRRRPLPDRLLGQSPRRWSSG